MLKLPGRGKKSVKKPLILSPYKQIFSKVEENKIERDAIKKKIFVDRDPSKKAYGALKLQGIEKSFGRHKVLYGVNLDVKPGKIIGIIGVSGSGKTTILRLVIGYYKPNSGTITFNGINIRKQMNVIDKNFGFATQENSFYKDLTVEENVRFFGKLYGLTEKFLENNVDSVLDLVELYEAKKALARNLSGGMQRRLDLACSMIHDPSVLILDEPTEDLDPLLRAEMLGLIKKINNKGTTVIFTTHLLDEAEFLCDEVAIIANGKILSVGTPNDLRKLYSSNDTIHLMLENGNYEKYKTNLKSYKTVIENNKLIVQLAKNENSVSALKKILNLVEKNKDKIVFADIRKPSLSEVFSGLTKYARKNKE